MPRRFVAAGLVTLCALAGLAGTLALRAPHKNPILGSVPIGNSMNTIGIDSRIGRAFVLDDGVLQQQVTLQGNGWSWSSNRYFRGWQQRPSTLVMLDPRDGSIQRLMSASYPSGLTFDETTNHVLILDMSHRSVSILDGTSGRLVRTVALGAGAFPIDLLLDEPRHRALAGVITGYNVTTAATHIAVIDIRTGATLRVIPIDHALYPLTIDTANGHIVTTYQTMSATAPDRYDWIPGWLRSRLPWVPPPPPSLGPNQRLITHTALTIDPS